MQTVARLAILVFVFTIPWENMIVIPGFGTISRLTGVIAFGLGVIAFLMKPQFRSMKSFHLLFLIFAMYSAFSYAWSVSPQMSLYRIGSNLQLMLFVWLIWQFVESERQVLQCIQAYVLGTLVAAVGTVMAWLSGVQVVYMRYSAEGFDPNELSISLAVAIPLAWYLSMRQHSALLIWANRLAIPLLLVAILLTGSRTGVVVACVGSIFLLLTLAQGSAGTKVTVALLMVAGVIALPALIPDSTWLRLATLGQEITSGTMNNRTTIWSAGLDIWLDNLPVGVGAGAFSVATQMSYGFVGVAHNTFLSILVELGAIGFLIFSAVMFVAWQQIRLLPSLERRLYLTVGLILMLGLFTLTWETKKPLWLLCSLVLCHSVARIEHRESKPEIDDGITTQQPSRLLQTKNNKSLLNVATPRS